MTTTTIIIINNMNNNMNNNINMNNNKYKYIQTIPLNQTKEIFQQNHNNKNESNK